MLSKMTGVWQMITEALKQECWSSVQASVCRQDAPQPGWPPAGCVWLALFCYHLHTVTHCWHHWHFSLSSSSYAAALYCVHSFPLYFCHLYAFLSISYFSSILLCLTDIFSRLNYNVKISLSVLVTEWVREKRLREKTADKLTDSSRLSSVFLGSCQGQWLTSWKIAFHNSASLRLLVSPALARPLCMCVCMCVCLNPKNKQVFQQHLPQNMGSRAVALALALTWPLYFSVMRCAFSYSLHV